MTNPEQRTWQVYAGGISGNDWWVVREQQPQPDCRTFYFKYRGDADSLCNVLNALTSERDSYKLRFNDYYILEQELATLRAERDNLTHMFEELTPGGSEFVRAPLRCFDFIRERLATTAKIAAERNALKTENEALKAKAALAGEMAADIRMAAKVFGPSVTNEDWLARYDALEEPQR